MKSFASQLGRREFIKKGICVFSLICVPQLESNSQRLDDSLDESYRKLLKIQQKYGGEFGDTRGGL